MEGLRSNGVYRGLGFGFGVQGFRSGLVVLELQELRTSQHHIDNDQDPYALNPKP